MLPLRNKERKNLYWSNDIQNGIDLKILRIKWYWFKSKNYIRVIKKKKMERLHLNDPVNYSASE